MAQVTIQIAQTVAHDFFGITSEALKLPGDIDENFKLTTADGDHFLLKFSSAEKNSESSFQTAILNYLETQKLTFLLPKVLSSNTQTTEIKFSSGEIHRTAKLLLWVPGRLWATINPKTETLRYDLGLKAGQLTQALSSFNHHDAHRVFDWNLANSAWTLDHLHLFSADKKTYVAYFQQQFAAMKLVYDSLPKTIVHNDLNDYNILVSEDLKKPTINGFIDFGDAVYTQTINDLAILVAYAIMEMPDPLAAALDVVRGYNTSYPLSEKELECLYTLVGMRLVTTVTKAALRKKEDPSNDYHFISEKPAWEVLKKWHNLNAAFAYYSFRQSCNYTAHPSEEKFHNWAVQHTFRLTDLFPSEEKEDIHLLDLKVSSIWMGSRHEFNDLSLFEYRINQLQKEHPKKLIAGGYCEPRPLYTSNAYDKEGNSGPESRTIHLGIDFWLPAATPVHALFDAEVFTATNDAGYKEYGGLIILKHCEEDITFFTLHGHLSEASAKQWNVGDTLKKGDCIGYLGIPEENGIWSPHLHFQVMLSMLDYKLDFPGVTYFDQVNVWKSICPNPNLLFKNDHLNTQYNLSNERIIDFRREHLGKGLSLSYDEPLHIVRGDGPYLIDTFGRKYLDTANNVNHVGHQHPKVVAAGQKQMSLLNTNTRYLHEELVNYTTALLKKFPKELSVVHIVNSGSEANELALRMAKAATGQKDMLAIEVGYHGNTNAVMDVSSYKFAAKGGSGQPETTHILPLPYPFRGKYQGEDCGSKYAAHAQIHIENLQKKGRGIAGFIGESLISCGGQIQPPKNYFKEVYQYVREAGGICIADEVQTGFGRMGSTFWAFEQYDVIPDIVTLGKPAGNGHPLALVVCTEAVANAFNTGMEFFNTFGGNPVSCAIGRTVLEVIEEENLQQNALKTGSFLKNELQALQKEFPIIGDVRGDGLFLGFELVDSHKKPLPDHAAYLANSMKRLGILISTDGPDYNVIKIKPPLVFNRDHAKELIFRLKSVFNEDYMSHF